MQRAIRSGNWFDAALYVSAAFFTFLVLLVPLYLLIRTSTAWRTALDTLIRPSTLQLIGNTIWLTVSVTAASILLAVPLAWLTTRTDLPGRRIWSLLHTLPLVMPSYIYAFLFVSFWSPMGLLQQLLSHLFDIQRLPSIYGFSGAFVVLTMISYPLIFLTVKAALHQMDTPLIEVAQTFGARKRHIVRHVLLPYLGPSITAGALLVALYTLRDFGAVTLLQFSTFTRVIYNRYQGFQLDEAATLALLLVVMTGIIFRLESKTRERDEDRPETLVDTAHGRRFKLGRWRIPALLLNIGVTFMALLMPLGTLGYWVVRGSQQVGASTSGSLIQSNTLLLSDLLKPAQTSLLTGMMTAVLAVLLAIPIAVLSVRGNGRLARFFERLSYASYALPSIVVALAFVYTGIHFVRPLYQTVPLLLAAYMVLFVPLAISAQRGVLARIPAELEEVGYTFGGSRWEIFRYVTLPLLRPGLISGGLLVFLTALKELPAMLLLSPLGFRTLSMLVWANISEAFFVRAAIPTLLLLLLSSVPLAWVSAREHGSR